MAKRRKNRYNTKAIRAGILGGFTTPSPTKKNIKGTAIETGKDLLIGVIVGGAVGAAIGKPSLPVGILLTATGHFMGHPTVRTVGLGIMASGGFSNKTATVAGMDGLDGVKERLLAFKAGIMERTYLDKLLKNRSGIAGIGELQYFNYADQISGAYEDDLSGNLAALDSIERQIDDMGMARLQGGDELEIGYVDISDRNL